MMDIVTYPEDLEIKPIHWPVHVKDALVPYTQHTFNENRVVYNPVSHVCVRMYIHVYVSVICGKMHWYHIHSTHSTNENRVVYNPVSHACVRMYIHVYVSMRGGIICQKMHWYHIHSTHSTKIE